MNRYVVVLPVLAMLAGCQGSNPYTASSLPLPPAPASPALESYAPASTAPAQYRSWSWQDSSLSAGLGGVTPEYLRDSISAGLDQRGLRPAQPNQPADLRVSASLLLGTRQRQTIDRYDYGGYYRHGPHPWHDGYGAWANAPLVRTYEEQVVVVSIELFDARSRQRVWQGQAEACVGNERGQHEAAIRQAIRQALSNYPPL